MAYVSADERRRQLVAAAGRVIRRVGVEGATTRAIAQEAGAPLPSLHYAFRDKDELLAGVCEHWLDVAGELLERLVPQGRAPADAVADLMRGFYGWVADDSALGLAQYELLIWTIRRRTGTDLAARFHAGYRSACRDALARTLPPDHRLDPQLDELTSTMATALDGCLIRLLATGDGPGVRADLERFIGIARAAATGWPTRSPVSPG